MEEKQLTELQIGILGILWERGEATTQDVHEELNRDRGLALTTVATLLSRLERKGVVEHRREGRQFVYRATVSRADVRHSKVRELTEVLFGGNTAALISHLVSVSDVEPGDLSRVRAMIEEAEAGSSVGEDA